MQVDTSKILFICGGAFAGLDKVITARSDKGGIGFGASVNSKENESAFGEIIADVEPEDLIKYGLIPEFVGRLPMVTTLEELDEEALIRILTEPKNAITKQYKTMFSLEGCDIEFREDCLAAVAVKAMSRKTGARGLRTILENTLLDVMFDLPAMDNVSKIVLDASVIDGNSQPLIVYEDQEMALAASDE